MNATPMQGRAGYEWATKQIATQQCQVLVLPWKYAFRHLSKNVESIPADQSIFQWSDWSHPYIRIRCMPIWVPRSSGPQILGSLVPGSQVLGPLNIASLPRHLSNQM